MTSQIIADQTLDSDLSAVRLWKNLIFLRDGRSVLGYHVFDTEADAALAAREGEIWIERHRNWRVVRRGGEHLYFANEYSHSVPIPVAYGMRSPK
jgi:hypothetical protein